MDMTIRLNKSIDLTDGSGRPLYQGSTGLTVQQAAAAMRGLELPLHIEAQWRVYEDAPFSVEHQVAVKMRRLAALAKACGRVVTRVEPMHGFERARYHAALVR